MLSHFSRSVSLLTLSFLLSSVSSSEVYARWAEFNEADIERLKEKKTYKVKKDGSWTMENKIHLKILNETGRQALSTLLLTYDATRETLEVLGAKTNRDGIEISVPKEKIEDKPLASDRSGLKKEHQVLIPFEGVTVGTIVNLKIKHNFFNPAFEEYFAVRQTFQKGLQQKGEIIIESEIPLFLKINDPRKSLDVYEKKEDSKHTVKVKLIKPIFEKLVGESGLSYGEPVIYTSISVSTEKDYKRIGKLEAKLFQPILSAPLPEPLDKIRLVASRIDEEIDCIDIVVASLIEKITYLGTWNTAEGALAPRSLETIITSGYGDCKEYSTCLAAILNRLGYQAKIAAVLRGEAYLEEENALPNAATQFNHAIVKAIGPSGRTYWIDPTNDVSMASGIFPDIANRPVRVLDPENPTYERIPEIDYQSAIYKKERIITIKEDGYVNVEGSFYVQGESAQDLTEDLNLQPLSLVKESFIKTLCEGNEPIDTIVTLPDFISRKVKPLKGTFSYGEHHIMTHTNYGDAFPLRAGWYLPYVETSQKDEGALYTGHPETIIKRTVFKNLSAKDVDTLAFSIQTPWLNAKRDLSVTEEGVVVTETIEKLKSIISSKDLKSDAFDKLKKTLRKYCDGVALIFSK